MKDNEVTRQQENDGKLAKGRDGRSPARMRKVKKKWPQCPHGNVLIRSGSLHLWQTPKEMRTVQAELNLRQQNQPRGAKRDLRSRGATWMDNAENKDEGKDSSDATKNTRHPCARQRQWQNKE